MLSVLAVEQIQRRKLYQAVVDRLMQRIESGSLAVGDQLPSERELMEVYGMGRVAEGAKHLLRMQPETLDHLKEAHLFLEMGRVRMAAKRAGPVLKTRHAVSPGDCQHHRQPDFFSDGGSHVQLGQ